MNVELPPDATPAMKKAVAKLKYMYPKWTYAKEITPSLPALDALFDAGIIERKRIEGSIWLPATAWSWTVRLRDNPTYTFKLDRIREDGMKQ